jgi:hypothetical protein
LLHTQIKTGGGVKCNCAQFGGWHPRLAG